MAEIDINGGVAATTLAGDITSGSTTINVADGSSYPPGTTNFYIVIDRGLSGEEIIEISARSGNAFTAVTRGADGTSPTSHSSGATVEHCVPALTLQEANTHANQTTGTPHGSAYVTPSGNVATATALETARTIGGVSFDGTADVDLPGVNTAGTQDTSGNAATATALETARTIGGVSFDGTADISVTATDLEPSASPSIAGLTVDTNTLHVDAGNNRVGIGTTSPTQPLDVNGTARFTGNVNSPGTYATTTATAANMTILSNGFFYRSTSSSKYKTQIEDLNADLADVVLNVRPIWYRSLSEADPDEWSYYGLLAEEVAEVEPRLVHFAENGDGGNEPEGVQYERFVVPLISLVQRQQAQINALSERLGALESKEPS